ncbi:hypothetical protein M378DRAFT_82602 [Amanita muscaria Koide BX008]|uniref:Uncharacterized protein n=1 Tax=Amanita muscaria (strain Koide BX008) TaxID=946122 RepID=A0A0C2WIM9_AMAMK|nr:hypothetical protein M378DRAFT_82602 [Amanita muscaria Koide BX008]
MLPTPPRSSHSSNKENRPNLLSTRAVAWAQHNQIHTLSLSPPKLSRTPTSASRDRPARSILKKQRLTSFGQLPQDICDDFKPREITPEPQDPLCDLKYLENPVTCIISSESSLKALIEAYNILAARLRSCITGQKGETDVADASWPLFQPLRQHRDAFVKSLVKDLGKVLVDPLDDEPRGEKKEDRILAPLPSPNNTPRKKKDGMTAEQIKYARDLCTVSHSVIKFLNVVWTVPAVCGIFSDEEHVQVLSQVLNIPLALELPTINARKTCALAIWLIQTQRLPKDVLTPTADKIVAALRRAIDGELGKEGKKGSVSDGLRAIHDLCVHQPIVFVKPFAPVLPTILQNLLAPTLALRVQACQALGGIVSGANKSFIRKAHIHARFARLVRFFLTRVSNKHKDTGIASVPSTPKEPAIIRTLRVTLEATDPQHSAQGPVWALNVIANFIALLGPVLIEDSALRHIISSLLSLGLQHPKSSVRALACIVWRPFVWAYFQPVFTFDVVGEDRTDSLDKLDDVQSLSEEEKEGRKKARKEEREKEREKEIVEGRKSLWKRLTSVVECQMGVMTIAALLSSSNPCEDAEDSTESIEDSDDAIKRVFSLLKLMILKGGQNCGEAIEVARRLVRFDQVSSSSDSDTQMTWRVNMLLPRSLFSATSNLLSVEFKSLSTTVRAIMERSAGLEAVRSLTREELSKEWVFDGLIQVWREAVACLEMYDGDEAPTDIAEVWDGLVKASVSHLQDSGDDAATVAFVIKAATVLIDIIQDRNIDLTPKATIPPSSIPAPKTEVEVLSITFSSDPPQEDPEPTKRFTNGALKLRIVKDLWATVRTVVPHALLGLASERFLSCLVKNEDELLGGGDVLDFDTERDEAALKLWSQLCAELVMCCDLGVVRPFWGCERRAEFSWSQGVSRMPVWRIFADLWNAEANCTCESSTVLICAPFLDPGTESTSVSDLPMWEALLDTTIAKALDNGRDSSSILEDISSTFLDAFDWEGIPCTPAFIRATDILLSRFDIDSLSGDLPLSLFRLVNDVLYASYPPSNQVKQYVRWVLRTLSDLLRRCDGCENSQKEVHADLVSTMVAAVKQSVALWITDDKNAVSEDDWAYDMEPLYGYLLSTLTLLPRTVDTLNDHTEILESALLGNEFRTQLAADAFRAFGAVYLDSLECEEWPGGLVRCLVASNLRAETAVTVVEDELPPSSPTTVVTVSDSDGHGKQLSAL